MVGKESWNTLLYGPTESVLTWMYKKKKKKNLGSEFQRFRTIDSMEIHISKG